MNDVISAAIAAEQLSVAREAVSAAWAGSIANFAVVAVTAVIALANGVVATFQRRAAVVAGHTAAMFAYAIVLGDLRNIIRELGKGEANEDVNPPFMRGAAGIVRTGLASARSAPLTDIDFILTANRIAVLTQAFADVCENEALVRAHRTNGQMIESLSGYLEEIAKREAELSNIEKRLKLKRPDVQMA